MTISRRNFLTALGASRLARAVTSSRPNIVLFECDSMDGRVMGNMGHPAAYTPNLDRLAERGALFRNAYCNSPQCCPSRASMWSGLQTHRCEGWNNFKGLERGAPTFQTRLEAAGYRSGIFGKTDYLSGAHGLSGSVSAWTGPANIRLPEKEEPTATRRGDGEEVHAGDWRMVRNAIAWLKNNAASGPFFLHCGSNTPHPAYVSSSHWLSKIDRRKAAVPPFEEKLHPVMEYMSARKNTLRRFSSDELLDMRRTYYAMVSETDAMAGLVMRAVENAGLLDSTYFIFTSDHGEMALEHRQNLKNCVYEGSARVPLIVAGPGIRGGTAVDALVSLVDLYPTLMDVASLENPAGLDGKSLVPLWKGSRSARADAVLSQYHSNMTNTGIFMLRRGNWKYVAYAGYEPQLFDVAADPDEMRNLADAHPEIVRDMDGRLRRMCDYAAVDAKVKRYDKESFLRWRGTISDTEYHKSMAAVYRGWTPENDAAIRRWLGET